MQRFRTILVGVDFSDCSAAALRQAARLAGASGARLHLVHVIAESVVDELASSLGRDAAELRDEVQRSADGDLQTFAATHAPGIEAHPAVLLGDPATTLASHAESLPTDLLVLGVYGASGPGAGVGSYASRTLSRASCSVLLVDARAEGPFRTVVVASDLSPASSAALSQAAAVARCDGATLRLLHVFDPPWRRLHYRAPTPEAAPEFKAQYRDRLRGLLQDEVQRELGPDPGLEVQIELVESHSPAPAIIEEAQRRHADLLAMGTGGPRTLRHLLLGSTAIRVLRRIDLSLLAARPPAAG